MPQILPVHNGKNHEHSLIFKDNGVGSQSSFINPYTAKTFRFYSNAGCHRLSSPPSKSHQIAPKQDMGSGRGTGEDKKGFLQLITRGSQRQNDNNNNKKACYCGVFLSTTSYTRGGYISRTGGKGAVSCL